MRLLVDGQLAGQALAAGTVAFSLTGTGQGTFLVTATAEDAAGNVGAASTALTLTD